MSEITGTVRKYTQWTWISTVMHDRISPETQEYIQAFMIRSVQNYAIKDGYTPVMLNRWHIRDEPDMEDPEVIKRWVIGYVVNTDEVTGDE